MSAGVKVTDPQERAILHLFRVMPEAWHAPALRLAVNLKSGMPEEEAKRVFDAERAAAGGAA